MGRSLDEVIERLTPQQRERVEARAAALKAQYEADVAAGRLEDHDHADAYVIIFADKEMTPEHYSGEGAALAANIRFEMLKTAWSVRLYRMVAKG